MFGTYFCPAHEMPIIYSNNIKSNVKKCSMGLLSLPFIRLFPTSRRKHPEAIITPKAPRVINHYKINRTRPFKVLFIPNIILYLYAFERGIVYIRHHTFLNDPKPAVMCCYRIYRWFTTYLFTI